jgi:DNA anti-recombination protein RmuC
VIDAAPSVRITVAGPTTLGALLNSLQMGFRALTIQKRSSEVWAILGAVKSEFGRFGDTLASVQKKLAEASATDRQGGREDAGNHPEAARGRGTACGRRASPAWKHGAFRD